MATSRAGTVEEYLNELPAGRVEEMRRVLRLVRDNVPPGYREGMAWGMIGWVIPLEVYPDTYNKQPLVLVALANQKNYMSLYLNPVYSSPDLRAILDRSGKKLKMGKSCINFMRAEELPKAEIVEILRMCTVEYYISLVESAQKERSGA